MHNLNSTASCSEESLSYHTAVNNLAPGAARFVYKVVVTATPQQDSRK